ncbi:glycosyltransferase family 4 protein [Aquimarina sp. MMG016]|uniref:glycosyltransferase family 4 protein n=1 Tax=Aquimarina sp. MMG016 TaxID=2822690 RepID=UPI001B39DEFF|nr:glycosyltransferase family 4 protein [Aquimarina sp. MMG016]MBQ4819571.1 glycosyltransferase family 4 protein [Aquimarina sp. MMG016]
MKLVYIVNRIDGPGGLERVLSIKASMLADHYDYDVHIVTLNQKESDLFYEFSPKLTYHNIIARGNPLIHAYKYASGLRKTIKKLNPDVIAVCDDGLKGFLVPLILGKPCPMVYERHVSRNATVKDNTSIAGKIKLGLMNYGGKFYDHFIVLTKGNLNEWTFKNLKVIPNPLSFYPEEQSSLKNKKVLAVGKQSFQKGYDRLLQSWKQVIEKHPDWSLDIYGTINKSEGLDELATDLGISETVHFHAPVKNIADKYKEASIYAMSSRYEGFGMVLTEAMAYGVPCVSFDCPYGPSDIITDGTDGYLVTNGDTNVLGERIINLIEDDQKRSNMGGKARESVKSYLPEVITKTWNELFVSLKTKGVQQVLKQTN